jgi:hypothetical protein
MAEQNADLAASWNGQSGERWVANQARLGAVVAAFGRAAIEAAAPAKGERVVDVGCGAAENNWVRLPMGVIKGILPPCAPPDPEAPGPFSFGDPGRVSRILTAAGFTDIAIEPFDASVPFGEGETRDAAIDDAGWR